MRRTKPSQETAVTCSRLCKHHAHACRCPHPRSIRRVRRVRVCARGRGRRLHEGSGRGVPQRRLRRPGDLHAARRAAGLRADRKRLRDQRRAACRRSARAARARARRGIPGLDRRRPRQVARIRHRPVVGQRARARPQLRGRDPRPCRPALRRRPTPPAVHGPRAHGARRRDAVFIRAHQRFPHPTARPAARADRHLRLHRIDAGDRGRRRARGRSRLRDESRRRARLPHVRLQRSAARRQLDAPRLPQLPAPATATRLQRAAALHRHRQLGRRERVQRDEAEIERSARQRLLYLPGPDADTYRRGRQREPGLLRVHVGRRAVRRPQRHDVHADCH